MHFTLVTAVAVLAHATQSFAAPISASYEIQDLAERSDGKENWKKAMQGIAGSIPDAALKVPVKLNMASVVQKAMAAAKTGPLTSRYNQHVPKFPTAGPISGPARPAPLTKKKSSLFQQPAPAHFKKPEPKPETQPISKLIAYRTAGAFRRPGKRDVVPEPEPRNLEIDELD